MLSFFPTGRLVLRRASGGGIGGAAVGGAAAGGNALVSLANREVR